MWRGLVFSIQVTPPHPHTPTPKPARRPPYEGPDGGSLIAVLRKLWSFGAISFDMGIEWVLELVS